MTAPKPPVAIRITRPYQSEEEFLAKELDTISRTGVTLVGAQQRPEGAMLRFELTLVSGSPLLRGEGRVVGYRNAAVGSEPGLSLRFTRLDSKSKAFVDRVVSAREIRRSIPPPAPSVPAPPVAQEPPPPLASVDVPKGPAAAKTQPADRDALLARLRARRPDVAHILDLGAERRKSASRRV